MESLRYLLYNLIIIISVLLAFAVMVKALVCLVKRLCAFAQRGIKLFKNNTPATHAAQPVITVSYRGNNSALASSRNDDSLHVRTRSLNKRNKKPDKEKENVAANEETNHGRINVKQARADRHITSINNDHGIGNVDRSLTYSQRRTYSEVNNQREKNHKQERNNRKGENPVIMNSQHVKDYISSKDMFHKTVKGAPSWNWIRAPSRQLSGVIPKPKGKSHNKGRHNKHLEVVPPPVEELILRSDSSLRRGEVVQSWNATRGLHFDADNERETYCNQTRNIGGINNNLMNELDQSTDVQTANSIRYSVRLWSVDAVNAETVAASENELQGHNENNGNNDNGAPASVAENLDDIELEPVSNETNPKTSRFSRLLSTVANAMLHMVMAVVRPFCDYVKKERERFNDIYAEDTEATCNVDPEVIACIQGEDRIHNHRYCPDNCTFRVAAPPTFSEDMTAQLHSHEIVGSDNQLQGHIRKETWHVTSRALWSKTKALAGQIKGAIPILLGRIKLAAAAVKSKVVVIVLHLHVAFSQIITTRSLDVIQKKEDGATRVKHTNQAASPPTAKADKSSITQPSPLNAGSISQRGRHSQSSDVLLNTLENTDLLPATNKSSVDLRPPTRALSRDNNRPKEPRSRKEKSQLKDSPTVGHARASGSGEKQEKFSSKGKMKKEVLSTLTSKVDEFAKAPAGKEKTKKGASSAYVDIQATTTCQTTIKPMPRLIPTSYVKAAARARVHVKDTVSPRVGISNLVTSAKGNETSKESKSHDGHDKSSAEVQDFIEHTVSRGKRRYNDQEVTSSDVQASKAFSSLQRSPTEGMHTTVERPRASIKRKAGKDTTSESQYEPILVDPPKPLTQMLDNGIVEQQEMMEVGESVDLPFITHPEAMVVNNEPIVVNVSFEEMRAEYYEQQASATSNVTGAGESMETNAQVENKEQSETVEMKNVQEKVSSWNLFSFSLPNFLWTPFTTQSAAEEMEVVSDQESFAQPVDVEMDPDDQSVEMDISPPQLFAPSGQPRPQAQVAAGMGRPQTAFVSPQQTMDVTQQTVDGCRVAASPFTKLTDAKRPLASTVQTLKDSNLLMKIQTPKPLVNPTVQVIQPAMQSVAYSVVQPSVQPMMQQAMHSVTQQPIPQLVTQEMMQSGMHPVTHAVMQPSAQPVMQQAMQSVTQQPIPQPTNQEMMQSTKHSVIQPALEPVMQTAMQSVMPQTIAQAETVIHTSRSVPSIQLSQVGSSGTGSKLYDASSEGSMRDVPTTGHIPLTSEVACQGVDQKSMVQLTMEQLQLVPTTDYVDFSDSESEEDSDEEFELDLETIEKFSQLEKSAEHDQFITKLLAEKESTQWHDVKDSDSDSDDDDKHERVRLLDFETIDKFSELKEDSDISLEQVERFAQLIAEKESIFQQCNM